jgi:hypothetical protein
MPDVVHLSVELKELAATQGEETAGKERASRGKNHGARLRIHHRSRRLYRNPTISPPTPDNSRHSAKVIGRNEKTDIALLEIDRFPQIDSPIKRGNSGEPTFKLHSQVIGHPQPARSPRGKPADVITAAGGHEIKSRHYPAPSRPRQSAASSS